MNVRVLAWFVFGVMASSSVALAQGSLIPPGPPGETMRTLQQIEPRTPINSLPYTISQPGSYYLTGNVGGITAGAVAGIVIAAQQVTLDLNGFTVTGDPADGAHGILVQPGLENVAIRNGTVRNWGGHGIEALAVSHLVLDNLHIRNSAGAGARISSGVISGLVAEDNGGPGVFMGNPVPGIGIVVKKNPKPSALARNAGGGVVIEGDFDVELSGVIHGNTGHGISWAPATPADGLRLKLEDCDSSHNTGDGLHLAGTSSAEARCEMADVTFNNNGGGGVFVSKPVPGIGIVVKKNPGSGARIAGNGAGGVLLQGDCDVEFAGRVSGNTGHGISWAPLNPADRITFKAKEGASVHNTGDGLHFTAAGPVDAACDLAEFSFERNGGDGVHIALPHPDSRLDIVHHQGRLLDNTGDGFDITAGQNGRQGFFDLVLARNDGKGCNKVDGGSNPGTFERCIVQDNGTGGLNLEGGSWTLVDSVIKDNGGDGVAVGARKHTRTGHVTLMKRGGAVEDNQGDGARVYPLEADADVRVVVQDTRFSSNTGNGLHVASDLPGSSITLDWLDSSAGGNGGSGMLIVPVAMDKGLRFRAEGGDCDDNVAGGITVDGDAVEVGSVHGLSLRGNGTWGLKVRGGTWRFADCTATDNPEGGFRLDKPGTTYQGRWGDFAFADCDAIDNGLTGIGIYGFDAATTARVDIAGGRIAANSGVGIDLSSSPGTKGRIRGVAVADNTGHGIYSEGSGWSITDNRVAGNANTGIFVAGDSHHVARNELADNAIGIYLEGADSAVRENTFNGVAQLPLSDGSGANAIAPDQNVVTGVNPLGNILF